MATLICFHAHPDDESIATGGTMARAKAEGHRVVLVLATRGECGEVPDGFLEPGEQLTIRRTEETLRSADVLGVDRVEWLGYVDSGMVDTPTTTRPYSFWSADVDHAARRLALILEEERDADEVVLTVYDDNGNYGHPDHIQVHRVGVRAAEMAGVDRVFEATMNRDAIFRNIEEHRDKYTDEELAEMPTADSPIEFGKPEDEITHGIDVLDWVKVKRESMRCHASQISESDFFMAMPDDVFATAFGTEWYIRHGHRRAEGEPMGSTLFG